MNRYVLLAKRLFFCLKASTMLLSAIVVYAAMLKSGKRRMRYYSGLVLLIVSVGISGFHLPPLAVEAKVPAKPKAKVPAGPPKQIYTRSERIINSRLLGASGKAAYIVSSVGSRSGILITEVADRSVAANIGLGEGDVLLTINQRVVTTAADADHILDDTPSGIIRVSFARQSEEGLQLYNLNVRYAHTASPLGNISSTTHAAGGGKSSLASLVAQIPAVESQMVSIVNADRSKEKQPPVSANSSLAALARAHAQDMANRRFFNHVNPDGASPQDRARRAGLGGVFENISMANGITDVSSAAEDSERQMMAEPPNQQNHRGTILNPTVTSVGIGIAISKDGGFYMVQEFSNSL